MKVGVRVGVGGREMIWLLFKGGGSARGVAGEGRGCEAGLRLVTIAGIKGLLDEDLRRGSGEGGVLVFVLEPNGFEMICGVADVEGG